MYICKFFRTFAANLHNMRKVLTIIVLSILSITLWAQSRNAAYEAYIEQYRHIAIEQQRKHGIPASITLAQALLESGAGKSELATKANNHFGIKCTSDWTGKTYKYSDNRANECFRKYADVADSYEDHSLFLKRKRYERLFALPIGDYKNWAYGLKDCGYATDPKYPEKLIRLIEQYDLQKLTYDTLLVALGAVDQAVEEQPVDSAFADTMDLYHAPEMEELTLFHNHLSGRRNGVRYVLAGPNESYASLAQFLNMYERTLRKYNDALGEEELEPGEIVYIYPKKNRASRKTPYHYFRKGDTARSIAQRFGIKMKSLYKINGIPYGVTLKTEQRLYLR